jgi:hypothetical protein
LLILVLARQSRWQAAAYLLFAGVAFLCLLASQHGYSGLSDAAKGLAPIAAFGIPLAALAAAHLRHPAAYLAFGAAVLAGLFVNAYILPGILRGPVQTPIPLAADAPLEAWWPYFKGPERERVVAALRLRPELQKDLIAGLSAAAPLEILHTFDLISALEPPATPELRNAFRSAAAHLKPLVTPQTEEAWRIRTRQAAEALGEPAP